MEEYVYIQTTARVSAHRMPWYVRFANEEASRLAEQGIELYHALYPVTGIVAHREDSLQIVHIWRVKEDGDSDTIQNAHKSLELFALEKRLDEQVDKGDGDTSGGDESADANGSPTPDDLPSNEAKKTAGADESTIYENSRLLDYDDGHLMEMKRIPIPSSKEDEAKPEESHHTRPPGEPKEHGLDMIVAADDGEFYLLRREDYTEWKVKKDNDNADTENVDENGDVTSDDVAYKVVKYEFEDGGVIGQIPNDVVLQPQQVRQMIRQGVTLAAIPTDSLPVRGSHCYLINLQGLTPPNDIMVPDHSLAPDADDTDSPNSTASDGDSRRAVPFESPSQPDPTSGPTPDSSDPVDAD